MPLPEGLKQGGTTEDVTGIDSVEDQILPATDQNLQHLQLVETICQDSAVYLCAADLSAV